MVSLKALIYRYRGSSRRSTKSKRSRDTVSVRQNLISLATLTFFFTSGIEFEKDDIPVLHGVVFTLLPKT
jgi:hypothetical protein